MKISIKLLDELCVETSLVRQKGGGWLVRGIFPTFVERPGRPHLSVFTECKDGFFTPHFTAFRRSPREFRRKLARIRPEQVSAFNDRFERDMLRQYARSLVPADLKAMDDQGWTAHWADGRALVRWLRPACKPGLVLSFDDRFAVKLARHVIRHMVLPSQLASLDGWRALVALRSQRDDVVEARSLFHFPEGVWSFATGDRLVQVHAPGWYWLTRDWGCTETIENLLPLPAVGRIRERLGNYLGRFPRRTHPQPREELPAFVAHILGFYSSDLLRAAVGLTIQAAESSDIV